MAREQSKMGSQSLLIMTRGCCRPGRAIASPLDALAQRGLRPESSRGSRARLCSSADSFYSGLGALGERETQPKCYAHWAGEAWTGPGMRSTCRQPAWRPPARPACRYAARTSRLRLQWQQPTVRPARSLQPCASGHCFINACGAQRTISWSLYTTQRLGVGPAACSAHTMTPSARYTQARCRLPIFCPRAHLRPLRANPNGRHAGCFPQGGH